MQLRLPHRGILNAIKALQHSAAGRIERKLAPGMGTNPTPKAAGIQKLQNYPITKLQN
jgi:hypothetical protein